MKIGIATKSKKVSMPPIVLIVTSPYGLKIYYV